MSDGPVQAGGSTPAVAFTAVLALGRVVDLALELGVTRSSAAKLLGEVLLGEVLGEVLLGERISAGSTRTASGVASGVASGWAVGSTTVRSSALATAPVRLTALAPAVATGSFTSSCRIVC